MWRYLNKIIFIYHIFKMKKYLYSLFFITLCSCTNTPNKHTTETFSVNKNGIYINNNRYDFGEIAFESVDSLDFSFNLKNISSKNITIGNIDVSCGCISISKRENIIKAGHSTDLKGKFGIKGQKGKIDKTIFVNYGNNDVLILHIIGNII